MYSGITSGRVLNGELLYTILCIYIYDLNKPQLVRCAGSSLK